MFECKHFYCECHDPICNVALYLDTEHAGEYTLEYDMYYRDFNIQESLLYGRFQLFRYAYYYRITEFLWDRVLPFITYPLDILKRTMNILFKDINLVYDVILSEEDLKELMKYDSSIRLRWEEELKKNYIRTEYPVNKRKLGFINILKFIFNGYISATLVKSYEQNKLETENIDYH